MAKKKEIIKANRDKHVYILEKKEKLKLLKEVVEYEANDGEKLIQDISSKNLE